MLLGVADAAGGKGIHTRIMPPERWQKMSTAKKQKSIRISTLNKVAGMMHIPQNTLREQYLTTVSQLIGQDPAGFARELSFDADQLNFFLSDKARSAAIIKAIVQEEKEKEKELQKDLQKKAKEDKKKKTEPVPELLKKEPAVPEVPVTPAEPEEKKPPAKTQSTLFDGF
jgi:replication factor C large subunit